MKNNDHQVSDCCSRDQMLKTRVWGVLRVLVLFCRYFCDCFVYAFEVLLGRQVTGLRVYSKYTILY